MDDVHKYPFGDISVDAFEFARPDGTPFVVETIDDVVVNIVRPASLDDLHQ